MIESATVFPRAGHGRLLDVAGLTIGFPAGEGYALAARAVDFSVGVGETLGIVGESGCGKSVSLRALLGMVPAPGRVLGGSAVWREERDLLTIGRAEQRRLRSEQIAMIFQDPQQSLDPVYSVGDQLSEVLRKRAHMSRAAARARSVQLLDRVGIPSAARRLRDYPHQLSGGMRQRVMIAIAISCNPALLLADEPTTALDVTIQDQILSLLADIQAESGMSIVLVSHDLGVIGQVCDRVSVMYAGRVVESGTAQQVLRSPRHPYTAALLAALPTMPADDEPTGPLQAIPGQPPAISVESAGCPFVPRCRYAAERCLTIGVGLDSGPDGHRSACPFVNAGREASPHA